MLNFEFREAIESKRPVTDLCDRSALASSNVSMIQTWDSTAKATWFYTTNACYRQLNEAIVADKEAALWPYMRLIRNINSYLVNHPPQSDITTMRGTWMSPDTFQSFRRGNTYRLSQYVSTSAKESVAADFKGTCLLLFNIPRSGPLFCSCVLCVVLCGVVWCGVVWGGVVWCGVAGSVGWGGGVWVGMGWNDVGRSGVGGVTWGGVAWCGVVCCGVV